MTDVVIVGVPTALGGQLPGMDPSPAGMARAPARLRELGLIERLQSSPALADAAVADAGDLRIDPGYGEDPDPRAKNRDLIAEFLPRERDLVAGSLAAAGPEARLLVLGGDCVAHAGAMAGLRLAHPEDRLSIAWFDAHGDYNDPSTTPSGNVWGMPFAMICGRGSDDLVGACDGPTVDPRETALLGGQLLDEEEARLLVSEGVAHFGSGMLGTPAGMSALEAWARTLAGAVDALYVAMDMDVLDASGGWAVQLPEAHGLRLETAVHAVRSLAAALPIVGFGATTINLERPGSDAEATVNAVVELAGAALS